MVASKRVIKEYVLTPPLEISSKDSRVFVTDGTVSLIADKIDLESKGRNTVLLRVELKSDPFQSDLVRN